jgi:hypothetical protein
MSVDGFVGASEVLSWLPVAIDWDPVNFDPAIAEGHW